MKKALLIMSALLALVACNKETPVKESAINPSKIVFNINVENGEATKGVKTTWENGDDVYVFFEDNTTQYVKMTYDGSSWTYKDKDGGTAFSGLTLATSGKKLSAVYMPDFVCSAAPTYDTGKWTFGDIRGYYQAAESVDYTVTSTSEITTLSATINLVAPSGISQIFIPTSEYAALGSGEEYVLTATHFIQFSFRGVAPGGAVTQGNMSNGFPLPAFAGTLNGETGLYFWGILEAAGTYDFDFQLVKQNAQKKYAISSKSKSKKNITVPARFAAKLTGLTDNGNFVSLGYTGGPLWATGNLNNDGTIANPLLAGDYYKWCYTTPYGTDASANYYSGDYDTAKDPAYVKSEGAWYMPTKAQFDALIDASNTNATEHSKVWKTGWTNIGTTRGGRLITSKVNGISLFFAAAGFYGSGSLNRAGERGYYGSSSPFDSEKAYRLFFEDDDISTGNFVRYNGVSVRPVKAAAAPAPSAPTGAIDGQFSVGAEKKVYFSKGNLRYVSGTWSFYDHQYDFYNTYSADAWDKFGWSTSSTTYGMSTSENETDYSGSFVDWGTVPGIGEGWYTLSKDEWYYLFNDRSDAANKYGWATVNDVHGIIILPDAFVDPNKNKGSNAFVGSTTDGWDANEYTEENWAPMEAAGAVFLPAAGFRSGDSAMNNGIGYYWSSTTGGEDGPYGVYFDSDKLEADYNDNRRWGQSVRLVRQVK